MTLIPNDQNLVRHISYYYTTNEFNDKIKQIMGTTNNTNSDGATDSTNNYNNNTFSLLHVNARSLNKNYDDLSTFLTTLKNFRFSVIGVTETWLHSNSPPIFSLDNYNMIRADLAAGRGGGVAIYLNNQLTFRKRPDLHFEGTKDIFIEIINDSDKNIIVGVIYRPPNNHIDTFLDKLDDFLNKVSQENKQIYLMGDYNVDLLSPTIKPAYKFKTTQYFVFLFATSPHKQTYQNYSYIINFNR